MSGKRIVNPASKAAPAKAAAAKKAGGPSKVTNIKTGTGSNNTQIGRVDGNVSISG